jgi:hypothetical protein
MLTPVRPLRRVIDHRGCGSDNNGVLLVLLTLECGHSVVRTERHIPYPTLANPGTTRARCDCCLLGCVARHALGDHSPAPNR